MDAPDSIQAATATGVEFNDRQQLKDHYHSDYHRYNLKRKVAGLPMLTPEQFERRQAQEAQKPVLEIKHQRKEDRKANRKSKKDDKLDKQQQKMQQKLAKAEAKKKAVEAGEMEEDESAESDEEGEWLDEEDLDEEVEVIHGQSLFDEEILKDWPEVLMYMQKKFGFIIPHIERVKDMEMLCTYLQIKINQCCRCLYTSKRFRSPEAAKDFMRAKGNTRFNSDTFEEEFGRFYHSMEDSRQEEKQRLQIVQHGAWGKHGEEGVTPSGMVLVPRELSWVAKQTPKPEEGHAGVILAKKEAEERNIKHYYDMMAFNKTKHMRIDKQDVHKQSKHIMRLQVKANKLNPIPFECMMFGR